MEAVTALTESLLGELLLRRKLHKYVLPRVKVLFLAGTVIGSFPLKKKKTIPKKIIHLWAFSQLCSGVNGEQEG